MATVYDKSSLFLAPSGVSNGTVFAQKPVPIYGSELVTNGDFTTDSNWTKGTGTTISGGTANFSNATGVSLYQNIGTQSGSVKVTFSVTNYTSGTLNVYSGGNESVATINVQADSNGFYSCYVERSGGNANIIFGSSNSFTGSIDDVSVKEVLSPDGDFTFTRGSNLSATRVNEAQLIEKGRENLLVQSNQFDTTWAAGGTITIVGGQSDKDGGTDAWLLSKASAWSYLRQSITPSGVNTFSVYAKANASSYMLMRVSGVSNPIVYFNLSSGAVSLELNNIGATIESVGSGWYRCSIVTDISITDVRVYPTEVNTAGAATGSIYIQDAQLEQGLVATSVITTGAGTVQAGLLENTPRLDYSGGATCPSLLLEPSRTNLLGYSEYYNTYWNITLISVTDNATTSPEGLQNASKLIPNSGTGGNRSISKTFTSLTGLHTFSVFAKAAEYGYISLRMRNSPSAFAMFDLTNGLVHASNTTAQMVSGSPKIEDYGNGWYRCSIVLDPSGSVETGKLLVSYSVGVTGDETNVFSGDGTSGIYIWGSQIEAGSYPTSYIPTYGVSQTRAQDDCRESSATSLIGQTEGTIYWEGSIVSVSSQGANIASFNYSTSSSISLERQPNGTIRGRIWSGSAVVNIVTLGSSYDGNVKIAFAYKSGDTTLYINGVQIGTSSTAFTFGSALTEFNLGAGDVYFAYPHKSEVKEALLFKTRLSNLDLAILTGATTYETFDEMALALNYTVYE